ncbi:MAG: hypothetical protein ACJAVI_003674, partial [Candidatus Azotimanducaceae bacterium]
RGLVLDRIRGGPSSKRVEMKHAFSGAEQTGLEVNRA